jgi:hypothetical protein
MELASAEEPGDGGGQRQGRRGVVRYLHNEAAPSAPRMLLGNALRQRRDALAMTQGEVARRLGWSSSKVSRLESGQHHFKEWDLLKFFAVYQIDDPQGQERLRELAVVANEPTWWRQWSTVAQQYLQAVVSFEAMAQRIRSYDPVVLHGLLQTEEYARALIARGRGSHAAHDALVKLRMERQAKFGAATGKRLVCVINEAALRTLVGTPDIMRRQVEHLIGLMSNPRYHLRLHEQTYNMPVELGTTTIFDFAGRVPKIAIVECFDGALIIQDEDRVDRREMAFDELSHRSLGPVRTRRKLTHLLSSNFYR